MANGITQFCQRYICTGTSKCKDSSITMDIADDRYIDIRDTVPVPGKALIPLIDLLDPQFQVHQISASSMFTITTSTLQLTFQTTTDYEAYEFWHMVNTGHQQAYQLVQQYMY